MKETLILRCLGSVPTNHKACGWTGKFERQNPPPAGEELAEPRQICASCSRKAAVVDVQRQDTAA